MPNLTWLIFIAMVVGRDGVLAVRTDAEGGSAAKCGSRLVSGLFSRPALPLGYSLVATVPVGACRLNVSEMRPSDNYIALKVSGGSFVINGDFAVSAAGAYEAAGARFVYARGVGGVSVRATPESVFAAGPLLQSVDIMILYQHPNPSIKYEYLTSDDPSPIGTGGTHSHRHIHLSQEPQAPHVPHVPLATDTRENTISDAADSRYRWKMIGFTPCSRICGGGVQTSRYRCVSSHGKEASAALCGSVPSRRRRRCGSAACGARWRSGIWSECPTCGPAQRTRQAVCVQEHNMIVTKISEHKCTEIKPHLTEKCPVPDCNATTLSSPENSAAGEDRRRLRSRGHDTDTFHDAPHGHTLTRSESRDRDSRSDLLESRVDAGAETSNDVRSTGGNFNTSLSRDVTTSPLAATIDQMAGRWIFSEWSKQCSSECGHGVQSRVILCASQMTTVTSTPTVTPAHDPCDARSRPPAIRECASDVRCNIQQWFTGPWSSCSASCGSGGRQTRAVLCVSGGGGPASSLMLTSDCARDTRPPADRACPTQPACSPLWYTGEWGECLGKCGTGQQSRIVQCIVDGGVAMRDRLCVEPRPVAHRTCHLAHCSKQHDQRQGDLVKGAENIRSTDVQEDQSASVDSSCVDRFSSCSLAVQARLCQYNYYRTACCTSCTTTHPYKISEVN